MISSGERTFANFLLFHGAPGRSCARSGTTPPGKPEEIEGQEPDRTRAGIKQAVGSR